MGLLPFYESCFLTYLALCCIHVAGDTSSLHSDPNLYVWLLPQTEDVEVDVESIVFDCVDSEGLGMAHSEADHCYSSMDRAWLWRRCAEGAGEE